MKKLIENPISVCLENGYFVLGHKMTNIVKYTVFYDSMLQCNLMTYFRFFLRIVKHYLPPREGQMASTACRERGLHIEATVGPAYSEGLFSLDSV